MSYKHLKNLSEPIDGMKKLMSIAWSETKIAVATTEESKKLRIWLFDDKFNKKDSFPIKSSIKNYGSYLVTKIIFNKDASKIVVAQSDNVTFVYSIGIQFGEKKTICNKFELTSGAVDLAWLSNDDSEVLIATQEGKIKVGNLKSNVSKTLFSVDTFLCSFVLSDNKKYIFTGHIDYSIYKYNLVNKTEERFLTCETIPYCLAFTEYLMVAGDDEKVYFYSPTTKELDDVIDLENKNAVDFSCSAVVPQYGNIVLGSYGLIIVLEFSKKTAKYKVSHLNYIDNYYTVTNIGVSPCGNFIFAGNLNGSLDVFERVFQKFVYKKFEMTVLGPNLLKISNTISNKSVFIKSKGEMLVNSILTYQDKYLIVPTDKTFIFIIIDEEQYREFDFVLYGKEEFIFKRRRVIVIYDEMYHVFNIDSEKCERSESLEKGNFVVGEGDTRERILLMLNEE